MSQALLDLAQSLIAEAATQGIVLRLTGSLAIREHCRGSIALMDLLGRESPLDIDFMGYSRQQKQIDRMFKILGYEIDGSIAQSLEYGIQRLIYHQTQDTIKVEVFLDVLRMSHTLDLRDRLELDSPSVSLVDLLLAKLQIHEITEKDIKDITVLLAEHKLGEHGREVVDVHYVLSLMKRDWGLYYTTTRNLSLVQEWIDNNHELEPVTLDMVKVRVQELADRIESEPKSLRWRLRAMIGPRIPWYQVVEDVE